MVERMVSSMAFSMVVMKAASLVEQLAALRVDEKVELLDVVSAAQMVG